jgi:hypothetical protein
MNLGVEEVCRKLEIDIPDRRRIGEKVNQWAAARARYRADEN